MALSKQSPVEPIDSAMPASGSAAEGDARVLCRSEWWMRPTVVGGADGHVEGIEDGSVRRCPPTTSPPVG
jgi:hypothetical protein